MTPEDRKRIVLALFIATAGMGLFLYGLGFISFDGDQEGPSRSFTAYRDQQSDDPNAALYGMEPIKAKVGALSWDLFKDIRDITREDPAPTPEFPHAINLVITPIFTPKIKQYDQKTVKIMGYMFPLEDKEAQGRFLMGPFPPTCAMHYHSPNNMIIEVQSDPPIPLTFEPILVEGTLTLLASDPENRFYRLKNTVLIKEYPETTDPL